MNRTVKATLGIMLGYLISPGSASEPTIPRKTPEFRSAIESLRYLPQDNASAVEKKLDQNFARDCDSYAYQEADSDLTVAAVFSTFPSGEIENFIKRKKELCPQNVNLAIERLAKTNDGEAGKRAAVLYLTQFSDFEKYPWSSFMWSFIPLLQKVGSTCAKSEIEAFHHIYCGYTKIGRGTNPLSFSLEQFQKSCPKIKIDCR